MHKITRYILIGLGLAVTGFILWYFSNIVAYILISAVLALVGRPLVKLLEKVKIKKFRFPRAVNALATLLVIWVILFTFLRIFIPLLANEANQLKDIDITPVMLELEKPISKIEEFAYHVNPDIKEKGLEEYITDKLANIVNFGMVSNVFGSIAGILGNIFLAVFAISFITFFFLKDETMFNGAIMALIPTRVEKEVNNALQSIRRLLTRYFLGICLQVTGIITLVTIGLTIVGVEFRQGLVIALFVGIMNVVPYLGPVIGGAVGMILGIVTHLDLPFYEQLLPMAGWMLVVFVAVQVIDNILFQPLIYSNSVNAHPMEIFLVIMIAGSLAGVTGMILAIPSYTILRVFAKEFFNHLKIVKKLTKNI